ncbi:MAG: hypothetical protein ABI113_19890, partial [Mucilaginibacter sp.]
MKTRFTLLFLLIVTHAFAQTPLKVPAVTKAVVAHPATNKAPKDTVIESDTSKENKEPRYFYLTASANVFVNTKGGAAKRFSPSAEFGKTFGIFDIGLATGRLNSITRGSDTTRFVEF